jgi:hypothetical protein
MSGEFHVEAYFETILPIVEMVFHPHNTNTIRVRCISKFDIINALTIERIAMSIDE